MLCLAKRQSLHRTSASFTTGQVKLVLTAFNNIIAKGKYRNYLIFYSLKYLSLQKWYNHPDHN